MGGDLLSTTLKPCLPKIPISSFTTHMHVSGSRTLEEGREERGTLTVTQSLRLWKAGTEEEEEEMSTFFDNVFTSGFFFFGKMKVLPVGKNTKFTNSPFFRDALKIACLEERSNHFLFSPSPFLPIHFYEWKFG